MIYQIFCTQILIPMFSISKDKLQLIVTILLYPYEVGSFFFDLTMGIIGGVQLNEKSVYIFQEPYVFQKQYEGNFGDTSICAIYGSIPKNEMSFDGNASGQQAVDFANWVKFSIHGVIWIITMIIFFIFHLIISGIRLKMLIKKQETYQYTFLILGLLTFLFDMGFNALIYPVTQINYDWCLNGKAALKCASTVYYFYVLVGYFFFLILLFLDAKNYLSKEKLKDFMCNKNSKNKCYLILIAYFFVALIISTMFLFIATSFYFTIETASIPFCIQTVIFLVKDVLEFGQDFREFKRILREKQIMELQTMERNSNQQAIQMQTISTNTTVIYTQNNSSITSNPPQSFTVQQSPQPQYQYQGYPGQIPIYQSQIYPGQQQSNQAGYLGQQQVYVAQAPQNPQQQ